MLRNIDPIIFSKHGMFLKIIGIFFNSCIEDINSSYNYI